LVKKALEWATNSTEFNHRLPPHLRALVFEELTPEPGPLESWI
jgi:hypothetical protein